MAGNDLSISDFLPSKNTQVDTNIRKNNETAATVEGDQQEAQPAPQPSSRKAPDGNGKKPPKASSSKNVHRVEEQVMKYPEFLDDLAINSGDNADHDAADGPPMGTGILSSFSISHEHLHLCLTKV